MNEADWNTCIHPHPMLEFLQGRLCERKFRLFGVACCRRIWHLLTDERSRQAIEAAEGYADKNVSPDEIIKIEESAQLVTNSLQFSLDQQRAHAASLTAALWAPVSWTAAQAAFYVSMSSTDEASDERKKQSYFLRDIFGNPFKPIALDRSWRSGNVVALAQTIYDERAFDRMPILADALEDAGCTSAEMLNHCRVDGVHVRGCWALDLVLGKE
ncbi:hypothetical protein AYO44_06715 [Planctomycetaceae bacterium SCGC AG-212-F19]|nr:hypothetical protein AYO44_06715 [Planctomycetaceae bacterium SCGC AG-212-F19]